MRRKTVANSASTGTLRQISDRFQTLSSLVEKLYKSRNEIKLTSPDSAYLIDNQPPQPSSEQEIR